MTNIPIDSDDFDFELPAGAIGAEISEMIDLSELVKIIGPNGLFTHAANVCREMDGIAICNATALHKGVTATASFELIMFDEYETEAAALAAIEQSIAQLQTGDVAVVEFQHFQLTYPPFVTNLPSDPDGLIQWEATDLSKLLEKIRSSTNFYFTYED